MPLSCAEVRKDIALDPAKIREAVLEDLTGYTYKERGYGRYILFRTGQYIETYNTYTDAFEVP